MPMPVCTTIVGKSVAPVVQEVDGRWVVVDAVPTVLGYNSTTSEEDARGAHADYDLQIQLSTHADRRCSPRIRTPILDFIG